MAFAGCATVDTAKPGAPGAEQPGKPASATVEKKAAGKIAVEGIRVSGDGDRVIVNTTGPVKYTVFKLNDPSRLIIDLPGVDMSRITGPVMVNNDYVKEITAQSGTEGMNIGRVVIGLNQGIEHKVRAGENMLLVSLTKNIYVPDEGAAAPKAAVAGVEAMASQPAGEEAKPEAKPEEKTASPAAKIVGIDSKAVNGNTVISVTADAAVGNYNAFVLDGPPRIVIDVWGVKNSVGKGMVKLNGKYARSVRLGTYQDKVRLVVDTTEKKLPPYVITKEGSALMLNIGPNPAPQAQASPTEAPAAVAAKAAEPAAVVAAPHVEAAPQAAAPAAPVETAAPATAPEGAKVTMVDYRSVNGGGRLTIARSKKTDYTVVESPDGKTVTFDIKDATIVEDQRRTLDATKLKTAVTTVSSYQESDAPASGVRVLVKLSDKTGYKVNEDNGTISVEFAALTAAAPTPAAEQTAEPVDYTKAVESTSGEEAKTDSSGKARVYVGKKIDIDMVDASITDVFRLLAEVSNLNIIASDDVKGTVSLRLKEVPWDQAFDIILKSKDLGITREGAVIRVAPADKLRKERESALAAKKAQEKLETLEIKFIPINYAAAADIEPHVKKVLSERGEVTSEKRTNTIIIKDVKKGINDAIKVITRLDTPIPQVEIEARIVEADSSFTRDLGIQWGIDSRIQNDGVRMNTMGSTTQNGQMATQPAQQLLLTTDKADTTTTTRGKDWVMDTGVTNYAVNLPAASTLGAFGLLFGRAGGSNPYLLDLRLSAGETTGRLKTISRPRVTTLDNKEAKIEQGESIPFETTSASGTSTTFIDANLSLTVTPHITPDGSVLLKIKASRNSIGTFRTSSGAPSINKKEASTEVLVLNGETTVIGGIVVSEKNDSEQGIPYLKDIPVLGWVFKNKSILDSQKELLIFITPTIIKEKAAA
ncbi:MAG: type IV pilus secretin PilQ [Deltaproteobacteria bacterium]|nr:type IV pilus secretin PilQ [Deltaproteobacteria bacterium]